jgi:ankyrin repeat protein
LGGETILFKACKKGFAGIVNELLRYGADVNLANEEKSTRTGSTADSLIWLLKPEQEPNNVFGLCSLYAAAEAGHEEIVDMLVQMGAELDFKKGNDGETAMYAAARRKHKAVAELLYKKERRSSRRRWWMM